MDKIGVEALIVTHSVKSTKDLEKTGRVIIEYNAKDDSIVEGINKLHKADKTVYVVFMKKPLK